MGWGVDAGVKVNLPGFGAGDDFLLTGAYTRNAVWYSGLPDMMWGENGQVNGNGQPMLCHDTWCNPLTNQWSTPTAWSVSGLFEHHFTPQFYLDLEGSVGQLKWSNQGGGCYVLGFGCGILQAAQGGFSPSATTWLVGADLGWNAGHQPELRPRVDVSEHEPGEAERASSAPSTMSAASAGRFSCRATGRAPQRLRRPVSASPVTSDRFLIS